MGNPFSADIANINVNADMVKRTEEDVRSDLAKLKQVVANLIQNGWAGGAAMTFDQVMQSFQHSGDKLMNALTHIEQMMRSSGQTFDVNNEEAKHLFSEHLDLQYDGKL